MTDSELRAAERRYQETGSVEDGAAWLRARVRAGTLDPDDLEYAAWLRHAPARLVLGERAPEPLAGSETWTSIDAPALRHFVERLKTPVQPVVRRALSRHLAQAWERARPGDPPLLTLTRDLTPSGVVELLRAADGDNLRHYAPLALVHLERGTLLRGIAYTASALGDMPRVHEVVRQVAIEWALSDGMDHTRDTGD